MSFIRNVILMLVSVGICLAQTDEKGADRPEPTTRCDKLPRAYLEYEWLKNLSPFYIYRSTFDIHYCSQAVYVSPEDDQSDFSGNGIVIQGNYTYSYWLNLTHNNNLWDTVLCTTGVRAGFWNVYANFKGEKALFCIVNCASDGIKTKGVICLGRTACDEADIEKFLGRHLKGVRGIKNTQIGCTTPQCCEPNHH